MIYDQIGNFPLIEIPSTDKTKIIEISVRDKVGTTEKEICMTEILGGSSSEETPFITIVNTDFANSFASDRWYSLFIDVKNGSEVSVDIDELDGNSDDYDNDILDFSHTFFTEQTKQSYTFKNPTFKAGWLDADTETNWLRIGMIYYRDCPDGIWPDKHGDEY